MGPAALADDDTGSRRGEVSALRWRHVDFDRGPVDPPQQRADQGGIKEKETGAAAESRARSPHGRPARTTSKAWEQRCAALGCPFDPDALVFSPAPDGSTPYAPKTISQRYRRMAIKLKRRSTRIHSLRHYSATELIAAGVDLRTVAGRLLAGAVLIGYSAALECQSRMPAACLAGQPGGAGHP